MIESELLNLLQEWGIPYQRFEHPPVYTCEEAAAYLPDAPGAGTKNLFLCAEKGDQAYLLTVDEDKRVDINGLGRQLGIGKLRFGSPQKMLADLGIEPGSVTLLALANDPHQQVKVLVDRDLWSTPAIQCHPLTNTATLVLGIPDVERFLQQSGHLLQLVDIPVKKG